MIAFTIVARNYLGQACTLARSYAHHHPGRSVLIIVADGLDGAVVPPGTSLEAARDHLGGELDDLAFKYNVTEFCTAIKPYVFKSLFSRHPGEKIVYLDPDTYVTAPLDYVGQSLDTHGVLLTPHLIECHVAHDHTYPEFRHLWEGIFNLGFVAIRDTPSMRRLVDWWIVRLRDYCYVDRFDGLHTDQKWMDYVPAYFPEETAIARHPGLNVAHWNLDERSVGREGGRYRVNDQPLLLFHFSGCDFANRNLTRHIDVGDQSRYSTPALLALVEEYVSAVYANGYASNITTPYAFNYFSDGTPVTTLHRRLYRELGKPRSFENPFSANGPFYRLLERRKLLDRSTQATKNYTAGTVKDLPARRRQVERLLGAIHRLVGTRWYTYLIKIFAAYSRMESHAFLLGEEATRLPATREPRAATPPTGKPT